MGETGTITHQSLTLDDATYDVTRAMEAARPRIPATRANVRAVCVHLYGRAWWIEELIESACKELDVF